MGIQQGRRVAARCRGGKKVTGIIVKPTTHAGEPERRLSQNRPETGEVDHHQSVPEQLRYVGSNGSG